MLTNLLLSRDFPGRDPQEALRVIGPEGDPLQTSRLLSDGQHLPPDYARAAERIIGNAYDASSSRIRARGELLRIGQLAAAAARTPVERAQAMRILSAATVDEYFSREDSVNSLLRRIGDVPEASLTDDDAALVAQTLNPETLRQLPSESGLRPLILRTLIGPDGRIVMTEVAQSTGSASLDHMVRTLWLTLGADLDLSATARGSFVWAHFPPVALCRLCDD